MARMRTIREAHEYIKEKDPGTALTMYALRRMVKAGAVPCVHAGNHSLINLDILEEILSGKRAAEPVKVGGIRPVSER